VHSSSKKSHSAKQRPARPGSIGNHRVRDLLHSAVEHLSAVDRNCTRCAYGKCCIGTTAASDGAVAAALAVAVTKARSASGKADASTVQDSMRTVAHEATIAAMAKCPSVERCYVDIEGAFGHSRAGWVPNSLFWFRGTVKNACVSS